jgi:hypothetical protein
MAFRTAIVLSVLCIVSTLVINIVYTTPYYVYLLFLRSLLRLLVTANGVPTSPILVTFMIVAIRSSETSYLTRSTRRNIPEDGILHIHSRENLKSYIALTGWTL